MTARRLGFLLAGSLLLVRCAAPPPATPRQALPTPAPSATPSPAASPTPAPLPPEFAEVASPRLDVALDPRVIAELEEKFPDFRKAYRADGLPVAEFAEFGPVRLFRNAFLKGWYLLLAEITARRNVLAL